MRAVREVGSIRAAFREWPTLVMRGFLWKHFRLPRREIEVHSRAGTLITAPLVHNVGALYTAVEVFAQGAYDCDWDLGKEPLVIDIGANIGAWILWLAERRPGLTGVCYEPDAAAATFLRRNLELNGLDAQVEVRDEAVTDRTGTAPLFVDEPGAGVSSLQPESTIARFQGSIPVATVSFPDAIDRTTGEIALVKMDCEGAEYDIVGGTTAENWSRVRRVVLEYHPTEAGRHDVLRQRFTDFGFAVVKEDRRTRELGTLWLARSAS